MDSLRVSNLTLAKQNFSVISRTSLVPVILALSTALLCSAAVAETTDERNACFSDAFRVCWSAIPDRNDVFHCLMDNRLKLNPACRVVMDRYRRPNKHRITRAGRGTQIE